jgi:serine phosphatase RsbU (regulator of sigma subunit)
MAARKRPAANNHLQEAMALLIRNQAAFVEQIARNDQERLALQRTSDERQIRNEEWQRKSDERFDRIEANLLQLPKTILRTILDQLPAIKKEIGFKVQK